MKEIKYSPNLNNLKVIKTQKDQFDSFFYSGHPNFLIPDFCSEPSDIWISYLDYVESESGDEIYDQDGGEVSNTKIIDPNTGLTSCVYTAQIQLDEDSDYEERVVEIEGYVVQNANGDVYFTATNIKLI